MLTPANKARGRQLLDQMVRSITRVPVSHRATRMVERIVTTADLLRAYESGGGTGLHSYQTTVLRQCRSVREAKRAFMRYVVRELGGDRKQAAGWCRMLASGFVMEFEVPRIQVLRAVNRLENAQARRLKKEAAA